MNIPHPLQEAIENEIQRFGLSAIIKAREELTERYRDRQQKRQAFMTTPVHRCAYVAARLPATYAAVRRVLQEVRLRMPDKQIKSLLDLGAGPGTAMWAACELFPEIDTITLIEKDSHLIDLGKRLGGYSEQYALKQANWRQGDLEQLRELSPHDLIILSYSIGELSEAIIQPLVEMCWQTAQQFLVIIEPGTPPGFERIRAVRRQLIELQSYMVAPCPHTLECPMSGGDWCHFSERVERSSLHRRLKEGTLGYEDEKFSYVAVSKSPCHLPQARVLRHPLKRSGHISLVLCTPLGLKLETISKKTAEAYKQARKLEWGSAYF